MKKSIYLTETENRAIVLLAEGKRLRDVKAACELNRPSVYEFHPFLHELRRKTGIRDIQDTTACAEYIAKVNRLEKEPPLTFDQFRLLGYTLEKMPVARIAERLTLSPEAVGDLLASTLKSIGVFARDPRTIRSQIRIYLAVRGNPHVKRMPLSPDHWQALRVLADGEDIASVLGYETRAAVQLGREACSRANVLCPGRGARRKLIQAFLAAHAGETNQPGEPVTMNDPLF